MRVGKRETKRGNQIRFVDRNIKVVKLKKENLDRETIKKGKRGLPWNAEPR
jgi:hypothetical protein